MDLELDRHALDAKLDLNLNVASVHVNETFGDERETSVEVVVADCSTSPLQARLGLRARIDVDDLVEEPLGRGKATNLNEQRGCSQPQHVGVRAVGARGSDLEVGGQLTGLLGSLSRLECSLVGELSLTRGGKMARRLARVVDQPRCSGVKQSALVPAEPAGHDLGEQRMAERDRPVDYSEKTGRDELLRNGERRCIERPAEHGEQPQRLARFGRESANARGKRELQALGRLIRRRELLEEQRVAAGPSGDPLDECETEIGSQPPNHRGRVRRFERLDLHQLESRLPELGDESFRLRTDSAHGRNERHLPDEERDGLSRLGIRPVEVVEEQHRVAHGIEQLPCDVGRVCPSRLAAERATQREVGQPRQRRERAGPNELQSAGCGRSSDQGGLADACLAVDDDGPAVGEERLEPPQLRLPPDEHGSHHRF